MKVLSDHEAGLAGDAPAGATPAPAAPRIPSPELRRLAGIE